MGSRWGGPPGASTKGELHLASNSGSSGYPCYRGPIQVRDLSMGTCGKSAYSRRNGFRAGQRDEQERPSGPKQRMRPQRKEKFAASATRNRPVGNPPGDALAVFIVRGAELLSQRRFLVEDYKEVEHQPHDERVLQDGQG